MFENSFDFAHGEEIGALRETVSRWAADRLAPRAGAIDREDAFPRDLWPELGELGLLGITAPEDHGGTGMGYLAHVIAMEEVSRASGSVGLSYGAHSNLCVNQIARHGTPEQKNKFLPPLCDGSHVGGLAMSEPGSGSDVVSMTTRADKRNDRYVLNGTKFWITNGSEADTIVLYAKTDPEAGPRGITAFLIERGMKGFTVAQTLDKLGMRGSPTAELVLVGHLNVLEHEFRRGRAAHAQLVERLGAAEALHAALDQEGGDAARPGFGIGLGIKDDRVGDRAVGDPELGAVENVAVVALLGPRCHRHHVRARAGLAHGEAAHVGAVAERRQELPLLLLRAVARDLVDAEVRVRAVGKGDGAGRAAHLLDRDDVGEIAHLRAAILSRRGDAEQAQFAHLRPEIAREGVLTVNLSRAGG